MTLIGVLGGSSILALFPERTDLFGAYGVGLGAGFFLYFFLLWIWVGVSPNFDVDWFLDGRRKKPTGSYIIPEGVRQTGAAMGEGPDEEGQSGVD